MKQGRAYQLLSWGAAAAVAIVLVAEWIALFALRTNTVVAIDRRTIVAKSFVELLGFSAIGILALGVLWRGWRRSSPILMRETLEASAALGRRESVKAVGTAAKEIALSGGMRDCEDAQQWAAHQLIMWGFIGLFATTCLDTIMNPAAAPLPLLHPVRLLGNLTGIAFMTGLTLAIARRALLAQVRASSHLSDWTFLLSLWGTGATGFAVQWAADDSLSRATAWLYPTHLVFIVLILASAPWTKFIHAAWRPTWVLYRALITERGS
ncbi:MAG TPA: respiratory nitrate reductase subunit gamma [Candidatus Binataceae bacterium]|nr:respiratory nitrate reductase subunit gamma [Candidatus Binataceae bacterium]